MSLTLVWIDFYKSKNSSNPKLSERVEDIQAIYINDERNQLLLKRPTPKHIIIKTKHAADILRVVYSIRQRDKVPVYEIPGDLDDYLDEDDNPDDQYLVVEGSNKGVAYNSNSDDSEELLEVWDESNGSSMSMISKVNINLMSSRFIHR